MQSDGPVFILVLVIVGLIAIAAMIYGYYAEKKRREELSALATGIGFEFWPIDRFDIEHLYAHFDWISQGHDRRAYNVIHGSVDGYDVKAFDYVYRTTERLGKSRREQSHYFSSVIFDTDVAFRQLLIRPENVLDKIAGAVGFDDIDFESAEFSRKFYVRSSDRQFAYDVIHARMMEFLLGNCPGSVQVYGRSVMLYTGSKFSPDEFRAGIQFLREFLGLLPAYLWQKLREV